MTDHIKLHQQDGVLEITFARPDKKNALTNAMYSKAREALEAAQQDKSIRVVLFSAEGNAFTAGNDLGDFANVSQGTGEEPQAHAFIQALGRAEKPIVVATLRPSWMPQRLAPLPRWAMMMRLSAWSGATSRRRELTKSYDRP